MSKTVDIQSADGVIARDPGLGILIAYGATVPSDNVVGYAPGCLFIQTDGTTVNTIHYGNIGTKAACNFDAMLGA